MKPIVCDVFSTRDLNIEGLHTFSGNIYVAGDAVTINGYVETSDTRINFQVLSGGFGKKSQHN